MRALVVFFALTMLAGCGLAAPPATPTPVPPTPITEGRVVTSDGKQTFVVVDRTMFDVLMKAADNRDPRPFGLALDTGDALMIDNGTRVRIMKRDGRVAQLEILDGKYTGRAGWQYESMVKP
jgi:hypothetical protein